MCMLLNRSAFTQWRSCPCQWLRPSEAAPRTRRTGAIMMWPLCAVEAGEELTRDCVPGPRSLQRAAAVLTLLSSPRHVSYSLPAYAPLQRGLHLPHRVQK